MAETEFVLSRERLHRFIEQEFAECIISKDDSLAFGRGPDRDLLERLDLRLQQLFIKHPVLRDGYL